MAAALPLLLLLLLLLSFCGCYSNSFSSATLTLLVVVLSTYFPFIFSKIKQLCDAGSMEVEEGNKLQINELVLGSADASPEPQVLELPESNTPSPENFSGSTPIADEKLLLEDVGDQMAAADESSPENEWSVGSISDDDSLIEIALPDGHYVGPEEPSALFRRDLGGGFPPEFSPESVFRQHGLMELLSEISEEDNLIEIDIAMGSIKCSRIEIKA